MRNRLNGMNSRPAVPGILQLIDTLSAGGAERVAVNLANCLPRDVYRNYLCATRYEGPLAELIDPAVKHICLDRKYTIDVPGLVRLVRFVRTHDIKIIHAHASALFVAIQASFFPPFPLILWHDHHGRNAMEERPVLSYRLATRHVSAIIAVNQFLVEWAINRLRFPAARTSYIPNFVVNDVSIQPRLALPGVKGSRMICVANLRPEKDHPTLIKAMSRVVQQVPEAHLLLVGAISNQSYLAAIKAEITTHNLANHVTLLGGRQDVAALIRACDIGVLSSLSEGLPLALLEYGAAGLPAVVTEIGQCDEVLDHGRAGILVPPDAPLRLAEALLELLRSPEKRKTFGTAFQQRVAQCYSPQTVINQICGIYEQMLSGKLGTVS